MKVMTIYLNLLRVSAIIALFAAIGCSNGSNAITPGDMATVTFDSSAASFDLANIGVTVIIPQDSIGEGEAVTMTVQVAPSDLPEKAYSDCIFDRVGWVALNNIGDPNITLLKAVTVAFPLIDDFDANVNYSVFYFDQTKQQWISTGRFATVMDDGIHATFVADSFGTWGVFQAIPLHVEAHASKTTDSGPASVGLDAIIEGGSPPYSVTWYYGDDTDPGAGVSVSHFYKAPGIYTPSVVVLDSAGRQVSDYININLH